jgi:uncharacterized protein YciI
MKQPPTHLYVIALRLRGDPSDAASRMDAHKRWIAEGFSKQLFLAVGSLDDEAGGCILAHTRDRDALLSFVEADPFVAEGIASAEIVAFQPSRVDARLSFLTEAAT